MMANSETTIQAVCDKHGEYTAKEIKFEFSSKALRTGCPVCSEERKEYERRIHEHEEKERRQRLAEKRVEARTKAGVPKRFEDKTLDNFEVVTDGQAKALAECQRVVQGVRDKRGVNLILSGKPGTGKTHLSCGMINALFDNHTVKRIDWPDLIRKIRATWSRDCTFTEDDVLEYYGTIELLILEEVGTGTGSDDEKARIFQVINRRYEAMLPTVIVTNLSIKELSTELGDRVIDRLREGERSLVVFDWPSYRQ